MLRAFELEFDPSCGRRMPFRYILKTSEGIGVFDKHPRSIALRFLRPSMHSCLEGRKLAPNQVPIARSSRLGGVRLSGFGHHNSAPGTAFNEHNWLSPSRGPRNFALVFNRDDCDFTQVDNSFLWCFR